VAELTTRSRNALADRVFGLPRQRKYPLDTHNRQVNAKGRATQMVKQGKLSPSQAAQIKAKANRLLGK
jgi:hypothetical protein